MNIDTLIQVLVELVILGVVFAILYAIISRMPEGLFKQIAGWVLYLFGALIAIALLLSLLPGGHGVALR